MIKKLLAVGMSICLFISISACAQQGGSSVSQEELSTISPEISIASNSSEHQPQSEKEPYTNTGASSDTQQDTTTISQVLERDGFTLDRITNIQLSINPSGDSVIVTTPEDIQTVWDTLSELRITSEGADQAKSNDEKTIEIDIQFTNPNHATHVVLCEPIVIYGSELYAFAEGFSEQPLFDLIFEFIEPKPLTDYQGLTQEQWNMLQDQKEKYGQLSKKARGVAEFNGEIECMDFKHLHWEHLIDGRWINYVGANNFESWLKEIDSMNNPDQCTIYSFAEHFSITSDELVSVIETNGGTEVYDLETLKRRYAYINDHSYKATDSTVSDDSKAEPFKNLTGEIIPISEMIHFSGDEHIGTQADLENWYLTIAGASDATVAKIVISDIASSPSKLNVEQANSIMQILKNSKLKTCFQITPPAMGGTVHVAAYGSDDKMLWHISFDDFQFKVEQKNNGYVWVFDGKDSDLIDLKNFA